VQDAAVADAAMVGPRLDARAPTTMRVWVVPPNETAHTKRAVAIDDVAGAVVCPVAPVADPALHLLGYGEAGRLCSRHHSRVAEHKTSEADESDGSHRIDGHQADPPPDSCDSAGSQPDAMRQRDAHRNNPEHSHHPVPGLLGPLAVIRHRERWKH